MPDKHTPGPWEVGIYTDNDGAKAIMAPDVEMDRKRIAMVDSHTKAKRKDKWNTPCDERDANARLIAAAPELYDCIKRVWKHAETHGELPVLLLQDIEAVIAKAGGA